jgi:hypothetical protein
MSHPDAARARWRADLREFGAAALDAAGLADMAAEHTAEAASLRAYADLMDELAAAKAGGDRNTIKEVSVRVAAFRKERRTAGPPTIGLVHNFSEPSDAELIAQGY